MPSASSITSCSTFKINCAITIFDMIAAITESELMSGHKAGKPLVSVITIFLNAERFIEEAIESVLAQSYDEWELLLVDDGSADASTNIARRYARQSPQKV